MKSAILEIANAVKSGKSSARAEVEKSLHRIKETEDYNVTISTVAERALKRADEIDARIEVGKPVGRLAGVPFLAKDNFLAYGSDTTAASNILRGFKAPYQATALEKLEAEDAILVAKANLDAFAHGGSTEHSDFGPTKNPHNPLFVPGGSSGGSAAAVALDIVPFALGTDTGGSIRLPASYCGVVGLKPTYGLVSRYGVVAMASSTDVIGPLTKNVDDAALILDIIAGKDSRDGTTIDRAAKYYDSQVPKKLNIGLVREYVDDAVNENMLIELNKQLDILKGLGHEVSTVNLPSVELGLAAYYILIPAEISSNLARYDGIKYGHTSNDARTLEEVYEKSRSEGLNDENKRRILVGNYVLSSGYYDAYYRKAQTIRSVMINEFKKAFEEFDLLVGPTAPGTAFEFGKKTDDPLKMYFTDIMTVEANLTGAPAISVPMGRVQNLPVGLQFIAPQRKDDLLLAVARQLQEAQNG